MINIKFLTALCLSSLGHLATAQIIAVNTSPPDPSYQPGLATQDYEPVDQQSKCTTSCHPVGNPFTNTWGPSPLPPGVYAAAINDVIGGPDDCDPCGTCYSLVSQGTPYCDPNNPDMSKPSCKTYTGAVQQQGPPSIKVLITNHCSNCDDVPGHFDVNQLPLGTGWDNPNIFWKKLDYTECM